MAMRSAYHFANAEDIARQDSTGRELARTFPAQIEALNRYRNNGDRPSRCRTLSVGDGGKAIVGNVTQHASVIVRARTRSRRQQIPECRRCLIVTHRSTIAWTQSRKAGHQQPHSQYRPDAGKPALRCKNPLRRFVPLAGGAWQRRYRMHGGAPEFGAPRGNQNARKYGMFTKVAIAEHERIQALLADARKLLQDLK